MAKNVRSSSAVATEECSENFASVAVRSDAPLAERLRPQSWEDFQGLGGIDDTLRVRLQAGQGRPPSLILWGSPGTGKTTLARLIGRTFKGAFIEHSAVLMGVQAIRDVAKAAVGNQLPTILFVDEIHRLNKGQQDAFLPHVESGVFTLIGATTEIPSFYLTNALLSRCKLLTLPVLTSGALESIAQRGLQTLGLNLTAAEAALFVAVAGADARQLLNLIEEFASTAQATPFKVGLPADVAAEENRLTVVRKFLSGAGRTWYDRDGDEHYGVISAFIKSLRGSDPDAALYWCFRMIEAGEDPRFVLRRMIIFASEDIGNAEPSALAIASATFDAFEKLGLPEGRIPIAQCVVYLALAPKSNRSYVAMNRAIAAVKENPRLPVPAHLRNAPTELMRAQGLGVGYEYPHDHADGFVTGATYLPDRLRGRRFYEPSTYGREVNFLERLKKIRRE